MSLNHDQFTKLAKQLVGLEISRPWQGAGSALFLELGRLFTEKYSLGRFGERERQVGEAHFCFEWDWRLENDGEIVCGSSNSGPKVQEMIESITGLKISDVLIESAPPEITIHLSNGLRFRSMTTVSGDPQWSIKIQSGEYLSCEDGELISRPGGEVRGLSQEENELIEWASETAKRWGTPLVEPAGGRCSACRNFERIDGVYSLLDFGVCSLEGGPLDGRVVNVGSGCPKFMKG